MSHRTNVIDLGMRESDRQVDGAELALQHNIGPSRTALVSIFRRAA